MYESRDQTEPTYDAKGTETVRRDTCQAVSKVSPFDWVEALCPTWRKIGHFRDVLPRQSLSMILKKLNWHNWIMHQWTKRYIKQVVKVIWHKTTSPPQTDGSVVFTRWRQSVPWCGHIGTAWRIGANLPSDVGTLAPPGKYDWICASFGPCTRVEN